LIKISSILENNNEDGKEVKKIKIYRYSKGGKDDGK